MGTYTVDFYCANAKLAVEVEGLSHQTDEARQYDAARDQWMKEQGVRELRFTCTQLENETQSVLATIDEDLAKPC